MSYVSPMALTPPNPPEDPRAQSLLGTLQALRSSGFVFLPRALALEQIGGQPRDWDAFADNWDDLQMDDHMADQGRYRRRRHGVFSMGREGPVQRLPDAPHYQGLEHNRLNGGIDRRFAAISESMAESASFRALSTYAQALFSELAPEVARWVVEAHQFRIEARAGELGQPTPEGVHRDGVDYVLVALVRRQNIESGTTTIHAEDQRRLGAFTLTDSLDLALLDDRRVWHGVTAVEPKDPGQPAWRDVLVLTLRQAG